MAYIQPIMTGYNTPAPYVISASSENAGNPAPYAMNNTGWSNWWRTVAWTTLPQWLKLDFGAQVSISSLEITTNGNAAFHFGSFQFQGSNNDISWIDISSYTGLTWGVGETKTWNVSHAGTFKFVRLYVTVAYPADSWAIGIGEWRMQGEIATGRKPICDYNGTLKELQTIDTISGILMPAQIMARVVLKV